MHKVLTGAFTFLACLLVPAGSRRAGAQQDIFRFTQQIETAFADVETSRLAGNCAQWRKRLTELETYMRPLVGPEAKSFTAAAREEYRTRLAEAAARPCPPQAKASASAPVASSGDLLRNLDEACGADLEAARDALVAQLNSAIRLESFPAQRRDLEADRAEVQRVRLLPCPPRPSAAKPPAPDPRQTLDAMVVKLNDACGDDWSVLRLRTLAALDTAIAAETREPEIARFNGARAALLRRDPPACPPSQSDYPAEDDTLLVWFVANAYFERDLQAAERARLSGNCALRNARIRGAREYLSLMQSQGNSAPASLTSVARLAAQELRPCPEPRDKTAVSQSGPVSLPPAGPTVLTVPASPVRNCTSIDRSQEKGELTCRCLGKAQHLGIRGNGPYEARSAICNAAIHAGVLPQHGMGMVRVIPATGGKAAVGRPRNGVEPNNWDFGFENAFTIAPGGPDPDHSRPSEPGFMTGSFDTELGPMALSGGRGTFGRQNMSTITPRRIAGPVLEADWEEPNPLNMSACADGRYRGRLRFVFTRDGFTGLYARCDNNLNSTWNGTRRKSR